MKGIFDGIVYVRGGLFKRYDTAAAPSTGVQKERTENIKSGFRISDDNNIILYICKVSAIAASFLLLSGKHFVYTTKLLNIPMCMYYLKAGRPASYERIYVTLYISIILKRSEQIVG